MNRFSSGQMTSVAWTASLFNPIGTSTGAQISPVDSEVAKLLAELPLASLAGSLPEPTEIYAYRTVQLMNGVITSQNKDVPWRVKDGRPYLLADCPDTAHKAPGEHCGCGIYAWKEIANTEQYAGALVVKVQLWGVVYEHTDGYRAEHAAIVGVVDLSQAAKLFAEAYDLEWLPATMMQTGDSTVVEPKMMPANNPTPTAPDSTRPHKSFWAGLFGA